jgi:hypothetical protein
MSELPASPAPKYPNEVAETAQRAAGIREVPSKEKTRPLMGHFGTTKAPKREEHTGR